MPNGCWRQLSSPSCISNDFLPLGERETLGEQMGELEGLIDLPRVARSIWSSEISLQPVRIVFGAGSWMSPPRFGVSGFLPASRCSVLWNQSALRYRDVASNDLWWFLYSLRVHPRVPQAAARRCSSILEVRGCFGQRPQRATTYFGSRSASATSDQQGHSGGRENAGRIPERCDSRCCQHSARSDRSTCGRARPEGSATRSLLP
jgi:hypothetical protein